MGKEVKVLGTWASPYSYRVHIALKLKGVEYDYVEEDLQNKSALLLQSNPVYKKIPVLIHNMNPISESSVILEYIDETWKVNPILPSDPYHRAQARFWARFIDDKLLPAAKNALLSQGEESNKAMVETREHLKTLENEIRGKLSFNEEKIGYLGIVRVFVAYWLPIFLEIAGKNILTREEFPGLCNWANKLLGHPIITDNLPNKKKLMEIYRARRAARLTL